MQQIYANTSKVMVDTKGGGNLLYLPLDKLMQAAGSSPAPMPNIERPSAPASAMENRDVPTRGSLSSRERGDR